MALILGGFIFTDYAIPEHVKLGGEHTFVTHRLIGGERVVDAMGPDDDDIRWTGRFQGSDAVSKAMLLDSFRRQGVQLPLIVDSQYYLVGVQKFDWNYERSYQVTYKIDCLVVASMGGGTSFATTLSSDTSGDLSQVQKVIGQLNNGAVS